MRALQWRRLPLASMEWHLQLVHPEKLSLEWRQTPLERIPLWDSQCLQLPMLSQSAMVPALSQQVQPGCWRWIVVHSGRYFAVRQVRTGCWLRIVAHSSWPHLTKPARLRLSGSKPGPSTMYQKYSPAANASHLRLPQFEQTYYVYQQVRYGNAQSVRLWEQ